MSPVDQARVLKAQDRDQSRSLASSQTNSLAVSEANSQATRPVRFQELRLSEAVLKAVAKMGFEQCTPIQALAIPEAIQGKDLMGCAQTGTGKTAAFCIPILEALQKSDRGMALILVPTRELAQQVTLVMGQLGSFLPRLRPALIMGGNSMVQQSKILRGRPRTLIATPGRLLDHLRSQPQLLKDCSILVLDEADRMLDMGFAPQLRQIFRYLPAEKQTLLFSATFPKEIEQMAAKLLHNPVRVTVAPAVKVAPRIEQEMFEVENPKKAEFLLDELNQRTGSVLIFTRTKRRTDKLAKFLHSYGHLVGRIHGDRSQAQRNQAIQEFRNGKIRVLVATDVAARGIDVPAIGHVINFDLPQVPEDFVHRIGRTARAGASGAALTLVCREERTMWRAIQKLLGAASPVARRN